MGQGADRLNDARLAGFNSIAEQRAAQTAYIRRGLAKHGLLKKYDAVQTGKGSGGSDIKRTMRSQAGVGNMGRGVQGPNSLAARQRAAAQRAAAQQAAAQQAAAQKAAAQKAAQQAAAQKAAAQQAAAQQAARQAEQQRLAEIESQRLADAQAAEAQRVAEQQRLAQMTQQQQQANQSLNRPMGPTSRYQGYSPMNYDASKTGSLTDQYARMLNVPLFQPFIPQDQIQGPNPEDSIFGLDQLLQPITLRNGGRANYGHGGMSGFVGEPINIMYSGGMNNDVVDSGISGILKKYNKIRSKL